MNKNFKNIALLSLLPALSHATEKPNIIFIMADDLGYSELGCYGNTFNETPYLDTMAQDGVRFTHAHSAASVSSPTRAALMTGQYPYRTGISDYLRGNSNHMRTDITTMAETLLENGYQTGIIGKWHLTGYLLSNATSQVLPGERGFSEAIVSENKYISNGSYFHPYHFNTSVQKVLSGEKEFLVDRMNYEAVEFIKRNKEKPFFLYVSHYAVHNGLHGPPETVDYFRAKPGAGTSNPSDGNPNNDPYVKFPADYRGKPNNPHLAAQLKHMDEGVGQIIQALRDNNLLENTLVIFTSDNGGATGVTTNKPLKGGKTGLYEGGTRIPMIFFGYGTENSPKTIDQRITSMDFFPTFCEMTGAQLPEQPCDGVSILPLFENKEILERDLFWYYPPSVQEEDNSRSIQASVISGNYKLIETYSYVNGMLSIISQELFDLTKDPYETTDLSKTKPDVAGTLSRKMSEWRNSIDAGGALVENEIIYVSPNGLGDGSSWGSPASFEQAVASARNIPNHEIWLKAGTYNVTSSIKFDSLFIYGGFEGVETRLSERNWQKNQTIIDGNDAVSIFRNTTGENRPGGRNTYMASIVDGLIIQNAVNPMEENGGAMILSNGAFVRNCIFRNNATRNDRNGAAIHCNSGYCIIENSLFINNTSIANGGAIQVGAGTNAIVRNCTFANNKAEKPGGAIGAANNTSHLTLTNSIAYNNLYGEVYNSFGQNTNINGGGTIISQHSAVESSSTKFTENDDTNHIVLNRTKTPLFTSSASIIGKGTSSIEIEAINSASYFLTEGSPCIDVGTNYEAMDMQFDLNNKERIQGNSVDMGAYEFESTSSYFPIIHGGNLSAYVVENELHLLGAEKGVITSLYNIHGLLLESKKAEAEEYTMFQLKERGVYFVVAGKYAVKVKY